MIKIKTDFLKRKKIFRKTKTRPNPNFYWAIIFSLTFVFTIIIFIFSFYFFVKINKEEIPPPLNKSNQLEKISKQRIDEVLEIFIKRNEISKKIQNSSAPVVDPSL